MGEHILKRCASLNFLSIYKRALSTLTEPLFEIALLPLLSPGRPWVNFVAFLFVKIKISYQKYGRRKV